MPQAKERLFEIHVKAESKASRGIARVLENDDAWVLCHTEIGSSQELMWTKHLSRVDAAAVATQQLARRILRSNELVQIELEEVLLAGGFGERIDVLRRPAHFAIDSTSFTEFRCQETAPFEAHIYTRAREPRSLKAIEVTTLMRRSQVAAAYLTCFPDQSEISLTFHFGTWEELEERLAPLCLEIKAALGAGFELRIVAEHCLLSLRPKMP